MSKGTTGGSVEPGDILEIRTTFVVKSKSVDSVAYYDTLWNGNGLILEKDSLATRTNEGKIYKIFTDAFDSDEGKAQRIGATSDTAIQINIGSGASGTARGALANTSKPSFYTSTCIIMATYRVRVSAAYGTKINWGGGAFSYRDVTTGTFNSINFKKDSLMVYQSPGLCPNAVSASNAIGVESNGTFGTPSGSAPYARNRGTTLYSPGYTYSPFLIAGGSSGGPQDYYYTIANNTSVQNYTTLNTWPKPDGATNHRLFGLWDIIGDHTGASNTAKGNPPCDTTLPMSATNPCGYMLVINSSYKTDTAFQYTVTNLCPNTYYELSAWVRNICYKCGCDSNGNGASSGTYIPLAPGDSSGVQPNLAFEINGVDYYTSGNIPYYGTDLSAPRDTAATASDTLNKWVKRGFTYLTGPGETGFILTIRNNAPGGGGNDWVMDDISIKTCLPNMKYSPSNNPVTCQLNPITIYDTVSSYFSNYSNYKWQRSTDGGSTWTDVSSPSAGSPTWNGASWVYTTSYTVPLSDVTLSNDGDMYRLVVATTTANLSDINCQVSDGVAINLAVVDCGIPLSTNLISFNGKLVADKANLAWSTSKEDEAFQFIIEKSTDQVNFSTAGTLNSNNNFSLTNNYYSFIDPVPVSGKAWYRLVMVNNSGKKKYSRIILLNKDLTSFGFGSVINPFSSELNFDIITAENTKINVDLIDLLGKSVKRKSYSVYNGTNSLSLENTDVLPEGIYTLRVENNGTIITKRVVKRN
ncbi:MAG: T9SS type A sorting domain-containing protein [Bacteroidetes bacterium]|nr:T9SS type A sorting domain-containing protein [Bacteroidota bacterium]